MMLRIVVNLFRIAKFLVRFLGLEAMRSVYLLQLKLKAISGMWGG
jgi:hypothetical protein